MSVRGISTPFGALFPTRGQVRTCSSAVRHWPAEAGPCDLHALGTPPALILSQDQTRQSIGSAFWLPRSCARRVPTGARRRRSWHTSVGKVRATKKRAGGRRTADSARMSPLFGLPGGETVSLPTMMRIPCSTDLSSQVNPSISSSREAMLHRREMVVADKG